MRFEIFYKNNIMAYGTRREDWEQLPADGVQVVIAEHDDRSQEQIDCVDYYVLCHDGRIRGSDTLLPGVIKYGEWMDRAAFFELRNHAVGRSIILNLGAPRGHE